MVVSFPRSACEIPGWSLTHPKGTTTWHLQILCRFSLCVSYQLHHVQLTNTGFHSLPQTELASLAAKLLVFQTLVLAKSTGTGGHMQECCRCPLFLPAALAVFLRISTSQFVIFLWSISKAQTVWGNFAQFYICFFVKRSHRTPHAARAGSPCLVDIFMLILILHMRKTRIQRD